LIPASRRPDSSASEGTEFRSGLHASKLHLNCGRAHFVPALTARMHSLRRLMSQEPIIHLSDHGLLRLRKRVGIPKKSALRHIARVLEKGQSPEEHADAR